MSEAWEDAARELGKAATEQARAMKGSRKYKRAATDMRQAVAEVLTTWWYVEDDWLVPTQRAFKDCPPLEQMRALKAAEAVIGVLEKGK